MKTPKTQRLLPLAKLFFTDLKNTPITVWKFWLTLPEVMVFAQLPFIVKRNKMVLLY